MLEVIGWVVNGVTGLGWAVNGVTGHGVDGKQCKRS